MVNTYDCSPATPNSRPIKEKTTAKGIIAAVIKTDDPEPWLHHLCRTPIKYQWALLLKNPIRAEISKLFQPTQRARISRSRIVQVSSTIHKAPFSLFVVLCVFIRQSQLPLFIRQKYIILITIRVMVTGRHFLPKIQSEFAEFLQSHSFETRAFSTHLPVLVSSTVFSYMYFSRRQGIPCYPSA